VLAALYCVMRRVVDDVVSSEVCV